MGDLTTDLAKFLANLPAYAPIKRASVTLTNTNILALRATPITLVAAPGANKMIVVDHIVLIFFPGVTPYVVTATTLSAFYVDGSGASVSTNTFASDIFTNTEDFRTDADGLGFCNGSGATAGLNNAKIVLKASGGAYSVGNGTAEVTTYYSVLDI